MSQHDKYVYSVTFHSDDLAAVHCLRALAQYSQKKGNNRIPWGNTKESDWQRSNNQVTFHFSKPEYRDGLITEANRLLPTNTWRLVDQSDNNPATPSSK